jgi:hypothetical protein
VCGERKSESVARGWGLHRTDPGQIIEDDFDIKDKVEEILMESGFAESRAAKMSVDDLLK